MRRVAVIDYGMGNLRSVSKALEVVTHGQDEIIVTADPNLIKSASHVVFPGVGAIRDCMAEITQLGLDKVILDVSKQTPFLGICLGMQALLSHSEENNGIEALGVFDGEVKHFGQPVDAQGQKLKVPHMGWNEVEQRCEHPLWNKIEQNERFYFVHSYFVSPADEAVIAGSTDYPETFTAAIYRNNVFAAQFHPEKSQRAGLQLLENFVNWNGQL
jgi:glutamine amidotransferase